VDIFAVKDWVIARVIVSGTHQAELEGIPASGKKIELSAIIIFRLMDGKVVEAFEEGDFLGLYQQLGMELKPIAAKKK
jgi:predicted ester cyclase